MPTVPLADNEVAAWRQARDSEQFGRERGLLFDTECRTSHTPACVKPLVSGWAFLLLFIGNYFILLHTYLFVTLSSFIHRNLFFSRLHLGNLFLALCFSIHSSHLPCNAHFVFGQVHLSSPFSNNRLI